MWLTHILKLKTVCGVVPCVLAKRIRHKDSSWCQILVQQNKKANSSEELEDPQSCTAIPCAVRTESFDSRPLYNESLRVFHAKYLFKHRERGIEWFMFSMVKLKFPTRDEKDKWKVVWSEIFTLTIYSFQTKRHRIVQSNRNVVRMLCKANVLNPILFVTICVHQPQKIFSIMVQAAYGLGLVFSYSHLILHSRDMYQPGRKHFKM